MIGAPPRSPLFPSPPLSRSAAGSRARGADGDEGSRADHPGRRSGPRDVGSALLARAPAAAGALARHAAGADARTGARRSEEHTSELQSQSNIVCRLLLEKKK